MLNNDCPHPPEHLEIDRARGQTTCRACGTIVSTGTYEMDPAFHSSRTGGGGGGGGDAGMRSAGFARPPRARQAQHGTHGANRPSIEAARRQMTAIAKKMQLPNQVVDSATVLYRQSVTANAIVGARTSVLCACLYIVCRTNKLPHTVLDFSEQSAEPPWAILNYVRAICKVTHMKVPSADPSFYVARFAEALNLGEFTMDVTLYALKVLHAMKDDWIAAGRRPLGICAAAVLVSCRMYGIERSETDFTKLAKLTWNTIVFHVEEFAATPAAALESIDDYQPTNNTVPSCYSEGRSKDVARKAEEQIRFAEADYFSLIDAAKVNAPITVERMEIWRRFVLQRSKLFKLPLDENFLDIRKLTLKQQFEFLGVPHSFHQRGKNNNQLTNNAGANGELTSESQSQIRQRSIAMLNKERELSADPTNNNNNNNKNNLVGQQQLLLNEDGDFIPELSQEVAQIAHDIKLSHDADVPDENLLSAVSADLVHETQRIAQGIELSLASSPLVLQLNLNEPEFDYRHESQRGSNANNNAGDDNIDGGLLPFGHSLSQQQQHHQGSTNSLGLTSMTQSAFNTSQSGGRAMSPSPYLLSSSQQQAQDNFLNSSQQFGHGTAINANNNNINQSQLQLRNGASALRNQQLQQQQLYDRLGFRGLDLRNRLTRIQLQMMNAPSIRGEIVRLDIDEGDTDTDEYIIEDPEDVIRKEKAIRTILQLKFNALQEAYSREVDRYEGRSEDSSALLTQLSSGLGGVGSNAAGGGNNFNGQGRNQNNQQRRAGGGILNQIGGNSFMMGGGDEDDELLFPQQDAINNSNHNNNNNLGFMDDDDDDLHVDNAPFASMMNIMDQQRQQQQLGAKQKRNHRRDTQVEFDSATSAVMDGLRRKGGSANVDQLGLQHLLQEKPESAASVAAGSKKKGNNKLESKKKDDDEDFNL